MKNTTINMKEHVHGVTQRRLINSEYQRGFMEGQQKAALEFAECIDRLLGKFDHVALAGRLVFEKQ